MKFIKEDGYTVPFHVFKQVEKEFSTFFLNCLKGQLDEMFAPTFFSSPMNKQGINIGLTCPKCFEDNVPYAYAEENLPIAFISPVINKKKWDKAELMQTGVIRFTYHFLYEGRIVNLTLGKESAALFFTALAYRGSLAQIVTRSPHIYASYLSTIRDELDTLLKGYSFLLDCLACSDELIADAEHPNALRKFFFNDVEE